MDILKRILVTMLCLCASPYILGNVVFASPHVTLKIAILPYEHCDSIFNIPTALKAGCSNDVISKLAANVKLIPQSKSVFSDLASISNPANVAALHGGVKTGPYVETEQAPPNESGYSVFGTLLTGG